MERTNLIFLNSLSYTAVFHLNEEEKEYVLRHEKRLEGRKGQTSWNFEMKKVSETFWTY